MATDGLSEDAAALSTASLWKGENDSDVEQMEAYDSNPLANAGAWTEGEAYSIYRDKLVRLRSLYTNQLARLKHSLAERRREFILEWVAAGGDMEEAVNPSRGGSLEDSAYRSYRRRSGEEAVLERRQKQRQIAVSVEFFSRKDIRNSSRSHHQHLMRLQGQYMPSPRPSCSNANCENKCLPLSTKCRRHVCDDPKQLLYRNCTYIYPSGSQCTSPVLAYLNPPLCGGHCDVAILATSGSGGEPCRLSSATGKASCHSAEKDGSCEHGECVERLTKSTPKESSSSVLKTCQKRVSVIQDGSEQGSAKTGTSSSVETAVVLGCVEEMELDGSNGDKDRWPATCEGEQTFTESQDTINNP